MILAIIQAIPTHSRRVIRTDSFAKFQHLCGMIEQTSYLAAHAACHATMNGASRTLVADADITMHESVLSALRCIFAEGPFHALVIPGLTDWTLQKDVCRFCQEHSGDFHFKLFLDPERGLAPEIIVERQEELPSFGYFAWPWVSTVTPGRRSSEWLPPSALIAPLALSKAQYLKGVHDLDCVLPDDAAFLNAHHVEVMHNIVVNRRTVIGRMPPVARGVKCADTLCNSLPDPCAPHHSHSMRARVDVYVAEPGLHGIMADTASPMPIEIDDEQAAIEAQILETIDARCAEVLKQRPRNDAMLWGTLQRTAIAVLSQAQAKGWVKRYKVRCDAETAEWGSPTEPVVEILLEFPKRVKQIKLNVERRS